MLQFTFSESCQSKLYVLEKLYLKILNYAGLVLYIEIRLDVSKKIFVIEDKHIAKEQPFADNCSSRIFFKQNVKVFDNTPNILIELCCTKPNKPSAQKIRISYSK